MKNSPQNGDRMMKAKRLVNTLHGIYLSRDSRLENHVGERYRDPDGCSKCKWISPGQTGMPWGIDYCNEAERLKRMRDKVASKAKVITLLILENVEVFR